MQLPSNKTVIFFSPHCDDETISAGALLQTLSKNNQVIVYYLVNSPGGVARDLSNEEKISLRQQEARKACQLLRAIPEFLNLDKSLKNPENELKMEKNNIELIKSILKDKKPALVLTLYEQDAHPTHQKTTDLVKKAIIGSNIPLWLGEVWTPIFKPNYAFYFNDDLMEVKLKVLSEYKSQIERTDWIEAIKSLNQYRAITMNETLGGFGNSLVPQGKYAEAFLIT